MHYGAIKEYDVANGEGIRTTLFVSGCTNRCPGCFQPATWDFHYGKEYTNETESYIMDSLASEYVDGLTLLGGEPFEPSNQKVLADLLKKVKTRYPEKTVWVFTGFVYDRDLVPGGRRYTEDTDVMLDRIDVLVDGPFMLGKRNLALSFRGSENQRVIDLRKTRAEGYVIPYPV